MNTLWWATLSGDPTLQNPLESDGHGEPALPMFVSEHSSVTRLGGDWMDDMELTLW